MKSFPPSAPPLIQARGSNIHFSHEVTVHAPSAGIWQRWMDVSSWPSWDSELIEARADAPLAVGVEGWLVPRSGPRSRFRVTDFVHGLRYTFETALPLARLIVRRELQDQAGTATFTHEVRFSGIAAPLFGAILGRRFRGALPLAMARLAEQSSVTR